MALTVKLPDKKHKEEYSLYVSSKIEYIHKDPEYGTLIKCSGCGIAFYYASNSRRAFVFSDDLEGGTHIPLQKGKLPYFKQQVCILYRAKGRKIDLLKFMCYNLEKKYGKIIYGLGILYWLTLGSYIDSIGKKGTINRLVYLMTEKYIKHKERLNQNENI